MILSPSAFGYCGLPSHSHLNFGGDVSESGQFHITCDNDCHSDSGWCVLDEPAGKCWRWDLDNVSHGIHVRTWLPIDNRDVFEAARFSVGLGYYLVNIAYSDEPPTAITKATTNHTGLMDEGDISPDIASENTCPTANAEMIAAMPTIAAITTITRPSSITIPPSHALSAFLSRDFFSAYSFKLINFIGPNFANSGLIHDILDGEAKGPQGPAERNRLPQVTAFSLSRKMDSFSRFSVAIRHRVAACTFLCLSLALGIGHIGGAS